VVLFIGAIQSKLFLVDQMQTLFRANKKSTPPIDLVDGRQQFKKIKMIKLQRVFLCCMPVQRKRARQKIVASMESQLTHALDTQTIIKYQRALSSLLRLLLSKPARKLI